MKKEVGSGDGSGSGSISHRYGSGDPDLYTGAHICSIGSSIQVDLESIVSVYRSAPKCR
jgi:hypothetical protein